MPYALMVPLILFVTYAGGFPDRMLELFSNLAHEERILLWADSWRMQQGSSTLAWLFGHGFDSFWDDFSAYTHILINFHSPHNYIMEVIYSCGFFGLLLLVGLYAAVLSQLHVLFCDNRHDRNRFLF